ncbi:uncharacterized protein LOC134255762 [Saccostrea cucullata]|uniref:uncharacterized protein LOC134255762 n=1 Tax=Saccostrea cuccullata TaxID=36930 RepID=UPI002ED627F0
MFDRNFLVLRVFLFLTILLIKTSNCQKLWNSGTEGSLTTNVDFPRRALEPGGGMSHSVDHNSESDYTTTPDTRHNVFTTSAHLGHSRRHYSIYPFSGSRNKNPDVVVANLPSSSRRSSQPKHAGILNQSNINSSHQRPRLPGNKSTNGRWVVINQGGQIQPKKNDGISKNVNQFFRHNRNSVTMIKPFQRGFLRKQNQPPRTLNNMHVHVQAPSPYKNINNIQQRSNSQNNGFHSSGRIQNVIAPYDKIQSGLTSIKKEVHIQRGMIALLQNSVLKMKHIFSSMQEDIQKVAHSIDVLVKMQ